MANFPTDDVLGIDKGERDEIKAELIRMRQYVMRKGLGIGDCVAWCKIKERFGIGIRDVDDEQWLNDYESKGHVANVEPRRHNEMIKPAAI